jgi:hypothetical protein
MEQLYWVRHPDHALRELREGGLVWADSPRAAADAFLAEHYGQECHLVLGRLEGSEASFLVSLRGMPLPWLEVAPGH